MGSQKLLTPIVLAASGAWSTSQSSERTRRVEMLTNKDLLAYLLKRGAITRDRALPVDKQMLGELPSLRPIIDEAGIRDNGSVLLYRTAVQAGNNVRIVRDFMYESVSYDEQPELRLFGAFEDHTWALLSAQAIGNPQIKPEDVPDVCDRLILALRDRTERGESFVFEAE